MVNKAKHVIEQRLPANFKTKMKYQVEDGATLSGIDDDSISVVVSVFGVFLIPDRDATLRAIQRVLAPKGGVFGTTTWTSSQSQEILRGEGFGVNFQETMVATMAELTNMFHKDAPWKQWSSQDKIQEFLSPSFETVTIHRSMHSVAWPSTTAMWAMIAGNPAAKVDTTDNAVVERAKQTMIELFGGSSEESPVFAWMASNIVIAANN